MDILELTTILLSLASVFSIINLRLLKLPQTIGLMILALILSILVTAVGIVFPNVFETVAQLTKEFDFSLVLINVMLPFLLFAGAISINLQDLLEDKLTILLLATFGVFFSTFVVGSGLFWLVQQPVFELNQIGLTFVDCLLFGALIAPTDPIAVLALLKNMNLSSKTKTVIAGESLFNDGIGVVIFLTLLNVKLEGYENITAMSVGTLFVTEVLGGLILGAFFGYFGLKLLKYIENEFVELEVLITLSLVLVVSLIAFKFHLSGPIGVVILGLFLNQNVDSDREKEGLQKAMGDYVYKFWHLLDETLNAILFILIGLEIILIFESFDVSYLFISILIILICVLSRFIGVKLPILLLSIKKSFEKNTALIITWGGLRGGLSVALALNLPDSIGEGKSLILFLTYAVVLFTILGQGLTIKKLIKE
ncbi:MAG: sodium:proton antiporter [Flavobacteriaceae bacterium]|nr:sodium:proton antiporter [Flavobacteriaceae bacterium]|tara:strand:- start:1815 stop:3086 length:1272 start_codon:yes stop_codon:yes gene_type:complete